MNGTGMSMTICPQAAPEGSSAASQLETAYMIVSAPI